MIFKSVGITILQCFSPSRFFWAEMRVIGIFASTSSEKRLGKTSDPLCPFHLHLGLDNP